MRFSRFGSTLILALIVMASTTTFVRTETAEPSRVVIARNPRAVDERNHCDMAETKRLFDRALQALTLTDTAAAAWTKLGITPVDTVAIKINCNDWTIALHPHPELLDALCQSLQAIIPAEHIIVYEAYSEDLRKAGFRVNRSGPGVRYFGADEGGGYDEAVGLTRIITDTASKVINLASLKCVDGDMGASLFLKNHIGSLLPADMSKCHDDPDFLAAVSGRRGIKNKTILNMCDGLRGTYRRGVPWYWKGIILARDPLAAETMAIGVINEKRGQEKLPLLTLPESLRSGENKYHLGTCQAGKIEPVRIDL